MGVHLQQTNLKKKLKTDLPTGWVSLFSPNTLHNSIKAFILLLRDTLWSIGVTNVMEKDLKMTSSVISNFDETISQIEEPSAMHDINTSVSLSSQAIRDIVKPADENVKQFTEMEVKSDLDFSLKI